MRGHFIDLILNFHNVLAFSELFIISRYICIVRVLFGMDFGQRFRLEFMLKFV